jgi:hypothetical protein
MQHSPSQQRVRDWLMTELVRELRREARLSSAVFRPAATRQQTHHRHNHHHLLHKHLRVCAVKVSPRGNFITGGKFLGPQVITFLQKRRETHEPSRPPAHAPPHAISPLHTGPIGIIGRRHDVPPLNSFRQLLCAHRLPRVVQRAEPAVSPVTFKPSPHSLFPTHLCIFLS